jgi:N-methylhydantoinase B
MLGYDLSLPGFGFRGGRLGCRFAGSPSTSISCCPLPPQALHDLTVVSPAFHRGRIVGLFANTAHVIDIGGLGMGVKCFDAGKPNGTLFDFIRAGSRLPIELEGDIYSLCACNEAGVRRLVQMMDDFAMESLESLAGFIFDNSVRA